MRSLVIFLWFDQPETSSTMKHVETCSVFDLIFLWNFVNRLTWFDRLQLTRSGANIVSRFNIKFWHNAKTLPVKLSFLHYRGMTRRNKKKIRGQDGKKTKSDAITPFPDDYDDMGDAMRIVFRYQRGVCSDIMALFLDNRPLSWRLHAREESGRSGRRSVCRRRQRQQREAE